MRFTNQGWFIDNNQYLIDSFRLLELFIMINFNDVQDVTPTNDPNWGVIFIYNRDTGNIVQIK